MGSHQCSIHITIIPHHIGRSHLKFGKFGRKAAHIVSHIFLIAIIFLLWGQAISFLISKIIFRLFLWPSITNYANGYSQNENNNSRDNSSDYTSIFCMDTRLVKICNTLLPNNWSEGRCIDSVFIFNQLNATLFSTWAWIQSIILFTIALKINNIYIALYFSTWLEDTVRIEAHLALKRKLTTFSIVFLDPFWARTLIIRRVIWGWLIECVEGILLSSCSAFYMMKIQEKS